MGLEKEKVIGTFLVYREQPIATIAPNINFTFLRTRTVDCVSDVNGQRVLVSGHNVQSCFCLVLGT